MYKHVKNAQTATLKQYKWVDFILYQQTQKVVNIYIQQHLHLCVLTL